MDGEEHTVEADARDASPFVGCHVADRRHATDTGVGEHDREPAELAGSIVNGRLHRGCIGDVHLDGDATDLGGDRLGTLRVDVEHRNPRALCREPSARRSSDARRAAGDDRPMSVETSHGARSVERCRGRGTPVASIA